MLRLRITKAAVDVSRGGERILEVVFLEEQLNYLWGLWVRVKYNVKIPLPALVPFQHRIQHSVSLVSITVYGKFEDPFERQFLSFRDFNFS